MSSKDKNLMGAIMLATAAFLCFYFVLPSYDQLNQLKTVLSERQNLLDSRTAMINYILKLKEDYNVHKQELEEIAIIIPSQKYIPEIISSLEAMATSNGVGLISINISESTKREEIKGVKGLTISVKLTGTYESYMNFLTSLETSRRLIDIELSRITPSEKTAILTIDLAGRAYVLSQ